jgi:hypothetical protein
VNQPQRGETEGPCALCRRPCERYGDDGRPLCGDCMAMAEGHQVRRAAMAAG